MDQLNSLIPALRSRNESAFGTVYQQTVDVFYRYLISSYGVSHQVAQDILSDVYIKLRNNVHSLQANSSLGAYLRTIVKNTAHDHFKKQKEKDRLATLGEMSAGLAHEIRNPLGAIKGAVQLIEMDSTNPNARFLDVIHEEVDRLNLVVTQFLEYSKPFHVSDDWVNLQVLTEKTVQLLKPSFLENLSIDVEVASEPIEVRGSFELLMQVWINLIQNSIKALTEVDAPQIRIKISKKEEVRIEFWDNGCGITKENLSKLFIPFFMTSPSGTGLGLAICSRIIEAHGGRIEVFSEVGQQTVFSVILPVNHEG